MKHIALQLSIVKKTLFSNLFFDNTLNQYEDEQSYFYSPAKVVVFLCRIRLNKENVVCLEMCFEITSMDIVLFTT